MKNQHSGSGQRLQSYRNPSLHRVEAEPNSDHTGQAIPLPLLVLPQSEIRHQRRRRASAINPAGSHDNAAMERALAAARGDEAIAVVRRGMIYGPGSAGREWTIASRARAGIHRIELPDGGAQFFARAALAP